MMFKGLLEEMPWGKAEDVKTTDGIVSSGPSLLAGLTDAPKGVREDVETNFNVGLDPLIASIPDPKREKFPVKDLLKPSKSSNELQRQAKAVVERQDVPIAISRLANAVVQSGEFLRLNGQLYRFTGVIWERLATEGQMVQVIRDVLDADLSECLSKRQLQELNFEVRTTASIQMDWTSIPRHPHLIACFDGVYDLDTDECRAARAEDYIFSQNNFYIDEIGRGKGRRFDAFLEKCSNGDQAI